MKPNWHSISALGGNILLWAIVVIAILFLCGCEGPVQKPSVQYVIKTETVIVAPDESLRVCKPRPPKPDLTVDPSAKVAQLITDLDDRGEDCASKLKSTWDSIDKAKESNRGS